MHTSGPVCKLQTHEHCFAASACTQLQRVYGTAPASQLAQWKFATNDVVHAQHLPAEAREAACTPPLGSAIAPANVSEALASPGSFFALECSYGWSRCFKNTGLLFRFDRGAEAHVCQGEHTHHGGLPGQNAVGARLGWVEVSHMQNYDESSAPLERHQLWMDLARGSGLWYWRGRALVVNDVLNCAECHHGKNHSVIINHAVASGYETLIFDKRIGDPGQIHPSRSNRCKPGSVVLPFYKTELVGLTPAECPPTPGATLAKYESACPNLPINLANGARKRQTAQPVGTECLWSAWSGRLRWGWPSSRGTGERCPICLHTPADRTPHGWRWQTRCNWTTSVKIV